MDQLEKNIHINIIEQGKDALEKSNNKTAGIRITTARYYTPSGESIQGKGITPDIIVEQGSFESSEFERFSESDLKDSLDKEDNEINNDNNKDEISLKQKRLDADFQLARAVDLIKGLSIYKEALTN